MKIVRDGKNNISEAMGDESGIYIDGKECGINAIHIVFQFVSPRIISKEVGFDGRIETGNEKFWFRIGFRRLSRFKVKISFHSGSSVANSGLIAYI